jgi:hypothetical protein
LAASSASGSATNAASLSSFLQKQVDHRTDSASAFQEDTTAEPSMRDLLEEQVKLQRQVRGIKNHLVRVQQGVLICQFLCVLMAGSLVALVSFVYFRSENTRDAVRSTLGERLGQQGTEANPQQSQWPAQVGEVETPAIQPQHQRLSFDFYFRASDLRLNLLDTKEGRMTKQESYIRLLANLTQAGEKLAEENAPQEVNQMLVKVASYAKVQQSYEKDSLETLRLRHQITFFCVKNLAESAGSSDR